MLKPLQDYLVIRPLLASDLGFRKGLIEIPESVLSDSRQGIKMGKVLAVGPGLVNKTGQRIPSDVKVGEVAVYAQVGITEAQWEGELVELVAERNVLMSGEYEVGERVKAEPDRLLGGSFRTTTLKGRTFNEMAQVTSYKNGKGKEKSYGRK